MWYQTRSLFTMYLQSIYNIFTLAHNWLVSVASRPHHQCDSFGGEKSRRGNIMSLDYILHF